MDGATKEEENKNARYYRYGARDALTAIRVHGVVAHLVTDGCSRYMLGPQATKTEQDAYMRGIASVIIAEGT